MRKLSGGHMRKISLLLAESLFSTSESVRNTFSYEIGYEVDVIYLDFCKAFNKVPHKRLLAKIECYGIKGKVMCSARSYF